MAHLTFTKQKLGLGIKALLALFLLHQTALAEDFYPIVTLYSNTSFEGTSIVLNHTSSNNLQRRGFDNMARSVCLTGTWLFYENTNYNVYNRTAQTQHIFGVNNQCVNLDENISGKVSSVRFAGSSEDIRTSTVTLYHRTFFRGADEYITRDRPRLTHLNNRVASLIITGSSPWTFYSRRNYQGQQACIIPPFPPSNVPYHPAFITNTTFVNASISSIRSVKKGCF